MASTSTGVCLTGPSTGDPWPGWGSHPAKDRSRIYIDRTPPQIVVLKLQNLDSELQTLDSTLQDRAKMAENSRHQGSATAERTGPQHTTNPKRRVALCLDSLAERPTSPHWQAA